MARLKDVYKSKIVPALREKYSYKSAMAVPKMQKLVVSMGVGKATQDKKFLESAQQDLMLLTGQKPLVIGAKKSVSNFKVRQGDKTGLTELDAAPAAAKEFLFQVDLNRPWS